MPSKVFPSLNLRKGSAEPAQARVSDESIQRCLASLMLLNVCVGQAKGLQSAADAACRHVNAADDARALRVAA